MKVIRLLFEANHLFGQTVETGGFTAERAQKRNRVHHQVCRLNDDLAHLLHVGLKTAQLEQSNDLCGLVHLVDGIVHRRDQVFDVASVKGGDERFSQRGHDLTRYLVCFVLASRYLLATAQHIVISLQQGSKRLSGGKRYPSMASEEVEESLLFRHQSPKPAQHERLARTWSLQKGCSRDDIRIKRWQSHLLAFRHGPRASELCSLRWEHMRGCTSLGSRVAYLRSTHSPAPNCAPCLAQRRADKALQ